MPEQYLETVAREFQRMKALADAAISQMPPEHFFASPAVGDNSVAVILKHVGGNLLSRWTDFLTTDGEKPGRDRDSEFVIGADDTRERLLDQWELGWATLFRTLGELRSDDLERTVRIRREALTVSQAINRQLTHYSYHVGQIVYVAKHYCGQRWRSLSIPIGKSQAFNEAPRPYASNG